MQNRRREDEKIDKLESDLQYIKTKIENGLTERSIRNSEQIEEIMGRLVNFEKAFIVHETNEFAHHARVEVVLDELKNEQNKWNKWLLVVLFSLVGVLGSATFWLITNAGDVAFIVEKLTK